MKYILLPIHPEWCCMLMNGDKKTEVRRGTALYNAIDKLIKEQGKAPCLIYCTKGEDILLMVEDYDYGSMTYYAPKPVLIEKPARKPSEDEVDVYGYYSNKRFTDTDHEWKLNGKVIAKFEASAEEIKFDYRADFYGYRTGTLNEVNLGERSCLHHKELDDYLREEKGTAIHVKPGTMKTDGFPKNLSDYGIKRAPQSFMYVEVAE